MALRDYKPKTAEVPFPGGSLTVRGITPAELTKTINEFKGDAISIYEVIRTMDFDNIRTDAEFFTKMLSLVARVPELAAHLIAISADEPDDWELALQLPTVVQYDCLIQIGALTFTVDGDLKKLLANLLIRVGGVKGMLQYGSKMLDQLTLKPD